MAVLSVIELGVYRDPQASPIAMMVFATMRWTLVYLVWTSLYFGIGLVRHRQEVELSVLRLERAQKARSSTCITSTRWRWARAGAW